MRRVAHTTGLDHDVGIDAVLLQKKQDILKVNGLPINTTVLDNFVIGGEEENNPANSLLTAKAIEDWFENLNNYLVKINPGEQGPAYRTGSINDASPSSINLPSCSAVRNYVHTKLPYIYTTLALKVNVSDIWNSIDPTNLTATNLVTAGGILNFMGNPVLTQGGVPIIKSQQKLYARSVTEINDASFAWIKAGVHDSASGYDETKDNRLATMKCTSDFVKSHFSSEISTFTQGAIFQNSITLPSTINIDDGTGLGSTYTLDSLVNNRSMRDKAYLGINLASCEFNTFSPSWTAFDAFGDGSYYYLHQLAMHNSQLKAIHDGLTPDFGVAYLPPRIQTVDVSTTGSTWLQNLPSNVNVFHVDAETGNVFILSTETSIVEVDWHLPFQYISADDSWTGVSYALPTDHRILGYNSQTKGVCIMVRSSEIGSMQSGKISWFDLSGLNTYLQSKFHPVSVVDSTVNANSSNLITSGAVFNSVMSNREFLGLNLLTVDGIPFGDQWSVTNPMNLSFGSGSPYRYGLFEQLFLYDNGVKVLRPSWFTQTNFVVHASSSVIKLPIVNNAWLLNLPDNVLVMHYYNNDRKVYIFGDSSGTIETVFVDWHLPLEFIVANDVWTGLGTNRPVPTDYRVIAYNTVTKGVCVLVRSDDTIQTANLSWFDLIGLENFIETETEGKIDKPQPTFVFPSTVTSTHVSHLDGVVSNIQTQLDTLEQNKHNKTSVDEVPLQNSTHLITSGGVYNSIQTVNTTLSTKTSETALRTAGYRKQSEMQTFFDTIYQPSGSYHPNTAVDALASPGSTNLVTSGGVVLGLVAVRAAIDNDFYDKTEIDALTYEKIELSSARANTMTKKSFTAFKTSADEILGDSIAEPISCTAYTDSGSKAVISNLDANSYHLLSPSGANIHTHLVANYVPIRTTDLFTVTRNGVGDYRINFGMTQPNSYAINLTTETIITNGDGVGTTQNLDDYMIAYHSKSSTGFGVYVKEQDDGAGNGTFRDVKFDFMCVSGGWLFAHGEVNGFTGTFIR